MNMRNTGDALGIEGEDIARYTGSILLNTYWKTGNIINLQWSGVMSWGRI